MGLIENPTRGSVGAQALFLPIRRRMKKKKKNKTKKTAIPQQRVYVEVIVKNQKD